MDLTSRTGSRAKLDAAEQEYDQLGDVLQAYSEAQQRIPERCTECDHPHFKNYATLVME